MLKQYIYKGHQYQFDEKEAPAGAEELKPKAVTPQDKAKRPANKARKAAKK